MKLMDLTEKCKKVSGSTLKIIGVITMLIDHIGLALIGRMMMIANLSIERQSRLYSAYSVMRSIGRLSFPIFCFLLVEGFDKTRSKTKYLFRLGIFALISEIPYDLAFSAKVLEFDHQNVYFTLFLGLLSLCAYVSMKKHEPPLAVRWLMSALGIAVCGSWMTNYSWQYVQRYILFNFPKLTFFGNPITKTTVFFAVCVCAVVFFAFCRLRFGTDKMLSFGTDLAALFLLMTLADLLHTDYSGMGVLTITVMYIFRKRNVLAMSGGCAVLTFKSLTEIPAFWNLIPIAMYNGKRGLRIKYFFYAFYPVHLLLLWLAAWFTGTAFVAVF